MSKSKQKGTAWETDCVRFLAEAVGVPFSRLPLSGSKDIGDIASPSLPDFVFECKNRRDALSSLSEILKETAQETENANASYGIALVKRRNHNVKDAYAVLPMHMLAELLKERIENGRPNQAGGATTISFS